MEIYLKKIHFQRLVPIRMPNFHRAEMFVREHAETTITIIIVIMIIMIMIMVIMIMMTIMVITVIMAIMVTIIQSVVLKHAKKKEVVYVNLVLSKINMENVFYLNSAVSLFWNFELNHSNYILIIFFLFKICAIRTKCTNNAVVIIAKIHAKIHMIGLFVMPRQFYMIVVLQDVSVYQDMLGITEIDVYDQTDVVIKTYIHFFFQINTNTVLIISIDYR